LTIDLLDYNNFEWSTLKGKNVALEGKNYKKMNNAFLPHTYTRQKFYCKFEANQVFFYLKS